MIEQDDLALFDSSNKLKPLKIKGEWYELDVCCRRTSCG
jgi:hypothetical protein